MLTINLNHLVQMFLALHSSSVNKLPSILCFNFRCLCRCNFVSTTIFAAFWVCLVVIGDSSLVPPGRQHHYYLAGLMVSNLVLLVLIFTHRVVTRIRHLITQDQEQMSRELAMTGNSWLPEHGEMPSLTGVPSARVLAGLATNIIFFQEK